VSPGGRRYQLTREGRYFLAVTLGVALLAVATGNNLLYLLLGLMVSLLVAAHMLAQMSLAALDVRRLPPARLYAGRPFLMGISLGNTKRELPSFSIEVEDLVDDRPLDKKCYFLKLPAGRTQRTSYRHVFPRRGRTRLAGFRLSTKFPFALVRQSLEVPAPAELIVLPAVEPVPWAPPPLRGATGDERHGRLGRVGEFYGLREYRDGDDPRSVHWRSSARRGRTLVREHEDETSRQVTLFVDNALPGGAACADPALVDALERAVSRTASLATHYLERGYAVRVVARGSAAPWAQSPPQLLGLLRFLALLPTTSEDVAWALPPDARGESYYVLRRGAPRPADPRARVLEA
jgi:uncharacterized protein (DUF58 family)